MTCRRYHAMAPEVMSRAPGRPAPVLCALDAGLSIDLIGYSHSVSGRGRGWMQVIRSGTVPVFLKQCGVPAETTRMLPGPAVTSRSPAVNVACPSSRIHTSS